MASTMAGEFAFSISLTLCVLYLGLLVRGLRTGPGPGRRGRRARAVRAVPPHPRLLRPRRHRAGPAASGPGRARLKWLITVLPVAGLLGAFWVVPFLLRHAWVNDMGWEKLPSDNATLLDGETPQHLWNYYLGQSNPGGVRALLWPLALAARRAGRVGRLPLPAGLPAGRRGRGDRDRVRGHAPGPALERPGAALLLPVHLPAGRPSGWPRWSGRWPRCWPATPSGPGPRSGTAGALLGLGAAARLPRRAPRPPARRGVPGQRRACAGWGSTAATATTCRPGPSGTTRASRARPRPTARGRRRPRARAAGPSWQRCSPPWAGSGQDPEHGCGRAFWEYGDRLETYGTPMAPMLLPYFTDGCIGSMEGLYFESSATTPYHFLTQCELSETRLVRAAGPRLPRAGVRPRASSSSSCSASVLHGLHAVGGRPGRRERAAHPGGRPPGPGTSTSSTPTRRRSSRL